MALFRKKVSYIEAFQWLTNGDHPDDNCVPIPEPKPTAENDDPPAHFKSEGQVVRYFRHPNVPGESLCPACKRTADDHGFIDQGGSGYTVCPGDFVVKHKGNFFPMKKEQLEREFEPVSEVPAGVVVGG